MTSSNLKEMMIPKYEKGMHYTDYFIKLMRVASTRGKMKEILQGEYMNLMPGYSLNDKGGKVRNILSDEQKLMEAENNRTLAELVMAMPCGRLTKIVGRAKSEAFPNGCAYTALQLLRKKIGKISAADEASLKAAFESDEKLGENINPSKYIDKLIDIKDELFEKYEYVKTERDIVDQVLKVLTKDYEWTRQRIKQAKRRREPIDLIDLQDELQDTYDELKAERSKKMEG
jgi:hypothetical protein